MFDHNGGGIKHRSDMSMSRQLYGAVVTGTIQLAGTVKEVITLKCAQFNKQKRKYSWLEHQSLCTEDGSRCK